MCGVTEVKEIVKVLALVNGLLRGARHLLHRHHHQGLVAVGMEERVAAAVLGVTLAEVTAKEGVMGNG